MELPESAVVSLVKVNVSVVAAAMNVNDLAVHPIEERLWLLLSNEASKLVSLVEAVIILGCGPPAGLPARSKLTM